MRAIKSLQDVQIVLRDINNRLDTLFTKEINLSGRKIVNAGQGVNPTDYVTFNQLPAAQATPADAVDQNLAIVFNPSSPIIVSNMLMAPYVPGEFRTGLPQWVRLAALTPPQGGNLTMNIAWKRKGATNPTNILSTDIVLGAEMTGPVKSIMFIAPLPFFDKDDLIYPTCEMANGAGMVSLIVGIKRKIAGTL